MLMGPLFFSCFLLATPPTTNLYPRLTPPNATILKELQKVVTHLPKGTLRAASGFSTTASIHGSSSSWFTDEGNVYYFKSIKYRSYQLRALLKGKSTHRTFAIPPATIPNIGVRPDGTLVIARNSTICSYSPQGNLLRTVKVPVNGHIRGFFSLGTGDLLIWDARNLLYLQEKGTLRWNVLLPAEVSYIRPYGVSPGFIVGLTNNTLEVRRWKTGRRLFSKSSVTPGGTSAAFGYIPGGNIVYTNDYKTVEVLDGLKGTTLKRFSVPWKIQNLIVSPTSAAVALLMEGHRLGWVSLSTGRFSWLAEMGAPMRLEVFFMHGQLVVMWNNRFLALAPDGRLAWTVPIPFHLTKVKFFRIPGGNMGIASENKVYFLYGNYSAPPQGKER